MQRFHPSWLLPWPKLLRNRLRSYRRQIGQAVIEYAVLIFLVALVVIGILIVLGPQLGNTFSAISTALRVANRINGP